MWNWYLTVVQLHLHCHYRSSSLNRDSSSPWCMSVVAGSPYLCQKPELLLCHLSHFTVNTNKQPAPTKTHYSLLFHSNQFLHLTTKIQPDLVHLKLNKHHTFQERQDVTNDKERFKCFMSGNDDSLLPHYFPFNPDLDMSIPNHT